MITSDSNQAHAVVKATDKRLAANRANARKSTGPKSPAGKALVAMNSVAHGIYSLSPVIEEVESKRSWTAYRFAMLNCLEPVGIVETTLAERIILTAWRQRRATHYEIEQIRLTQESATEVVGVRLGLERVIAANEVEEFLSDAEWREQTYQNVERFGRASDEAVWPEEKAEELFWQVHEQLGLTDSFDDYWQQLPEPEAWTAGMIRQLVRSLAEQHGKSCDELLVAMRHKALTEAAKSGRVAGAVKHQLDEYRRENLLPSNETLEKVMRYETHLSRLFHRDLHELQRLQAMRLGHPLAAPIAIDIDVSTESKSEPGGTE